MESDIDELLSKCLARQKDENKTMETQQIGSRDS